MPTEEQKAVEPDVELINVVRTFNRLQPLCSISNKSKGEPQLAIQKKQLGLLANELNDTLLCINLAKHGQHAIRDTKVNSNLHESIIHYENLDSVVKNEKGQDAELDCLNYLAQKHIRELSKQVPSETDELALIENAQNRLRRMEQRLDLATKRFCVVNTDNRQLRDEINRLLIERKNFNVQWNKTIMKLVKGKDYLADILEIATITFGKRDEFCKRLETLKWQGLWQLNKDIIEMHDHEGELSYLAKIEEFLRVKGTLRICETRDIEEKKKHEDIIKCEEEVERLNSLLDEIFEYAGSNKSISRQFQCVDVENFSIFILLCEVFQGSTAIRKELDQLRQKILDQIDMSQAAEDIREKKITDLTLQLKEIQQHNQAKQKQYEVENAKLTKAITAIDEMVKLANCDITPILSLLGNVHNEVTQWNVNKYLKILESEIKSFIQVLYGVAKPPQSHRKSVQALAPRKLVADPRVEILRPNQIENLVPYEPCAYCVEDYIVNLVYETPAVPADEKYIDNILHLEDNNTKFGIYTLTIPS